MKYSFILLTHNRPELMYRVLAHHALTSYGNSETIVVDTSTDDCTWRQLRGMNTLQYIHFPGREDVADGWNIGLRHARGEVIFLFEDDVLLPDGWFDEATTFYESMGAYIGLFGWNPGYLLRMADENMKHPNEFLTEPQDALNPYKLFLAPDGGIYGSCFLSRYVFDEIGYFDTSLGRIGYSRQDYGKRAHARGYLNAYILREESYIDRAEHLVCQPNEEREQWHRASKEKFMKKWLHLESLKQPYKDHFRVDYNE